MSNKQKLLEEYCDIQNELKIMTTKMDDILRLKESASSRYKTAKTDRRKRVIIEELRDHIRKIDFDKEKYQSLNARKLYIEEIFTVENPDANTNAIIEAAIKKNIDNDVEDDIEENTEEDTHVISKVKSQTNLKATLKATPDAKTQLKLKATPEVKTYTKPKATSEMKSEIKSKVKAKIKSDIRSEMIAQTSRLSDTFVSHVDVSEAKPIMHYNAIQKVNPDIVTKLSSLINKYECFKN